MAIKLNWDTSSANTLEYMFNGCALLTDAAFGSSFGSSNVKNITGMFQACLRITNITFDSSFSGLTEASKLFKACAVLTSIDLSKFNLTNVADLSEIFYGCNKLSSIQLPTSASYTTTSTESMFRNCNALISLDLSNLTFTCSGSMASMFDGCTKITDLKLPKCSTSNVTNMSKMFNQCALLVKLTLSNSFVISSNATTSNMFDGCTKLKWIYVGELNDTQAANWLNVLNVTEDVWAYYKTSGILSKTTDPYVNSGDVYLTRSYYDYPGNDGVAVINIGKIIDEGILVGCEGSFNGQGANLLEVSNLTQLETSHVTTFESMFQDCSAIESLNLSSFSSAACTTMKNMFNGCTGLKSIEFGPNFNLVATRNNMFLNCDDLESVYIGERTTSVQNDWIAMLPSPQQWEYNAGVITKKGTVVLSQTYYGFSGTVATIKLEDLEKAGILIGCQEAFKDKTAMTSVSNLSSLKATNEMTDLSSMFNNCTSLQSVAFGSNFNTSGVTDMSSMFYDCSTLKELDLTNFITKSSTLMNNMFYGCSNLWVLRLSGQFVLGPHSNMFTNAGLRYIKTPEPPANSLLQVLGDKWTYYGDSYSFLSNTEEPYWRTNTIKLTSDYYANDGTIDIPQIILAGKLTSCEGAYNAKTAIQSVSNLNQLNTKYVESMYHMFNGSGVKTINMTGMNTSAVLTMEAMFSSCTSLSSVNFGSIDTSKVQNMDNMFYKCSALTSLTIPFNTSAVISMVQMFGGVGVTGTLDLSSFNTSKVTDMTRMFADSTGIAKIIVTNNFTLAATTTSMFVGCTGLQEVVIGTSTNSSKWIECLQNSIPGTSWEYDSSSRSIKLKQTIELNSKYYTITGTAATISTTAIANKIITTCAGAFSTENTANTSVKTQLQNMTEVTNLNSIDVTNATSMNSMFYGCTKLAHFP